MGLQAQPLRGAALVVHGGGPTPVINASLAGVILETAEQPGIDGLLGARYGVAGVLAEDFTDLGRLSRSEVEELARTPSSALGSCRREIAAADFERMLGAIRRHDVRFLFFNGGNGSMYAASQIRGARMRLATNCG